MQGNCLSTSFQVDCLCLEVLFDCVVCLFMGKELAAAEIKKTVCKWNTMDSCKIGYLLLLSSFESIEIRKQEVILQQRLYSSVRCWRNKIMHRSQKGTKVFGMNVHWILTRIYGFIKDSLLCSKINPDYLLSKQSKTRECICFLVLSLLIMFSWGRMGHFKFINGK